MQVWKIREPGGPEVMTLEERADPGPGSGEIVVRVEAVGINRADVLQRKGGYPAPPGTVADVPGLEYAGVVESAGDGCTLRGPGERVMGLVAGGAYAERVRVHERETLRVPAGLESIDAAAIPEAFLTAWRAVFVVGGLEPGGLCVVRAATSGVGTAAVQVVRALGGRSLGTSRSPERAAAVQTIGADHVAVDGERPLAEAVHAINDGEGADLVLDLLGGGHLEENLAALRPEGSLVIVGLMAGRRDEIDLGAVLMRRLAIRPMTMRSLPLERRIALTRRFERTVMPRFETGALRPIVDHVVPFVEAPEAHRLMEAGGHLGKLVLSLGRKG